MPRVSAEHKQYYRSKIRALLVENPQITQRELQEHLQKGGLNLDRKYLGTLLKGIYAERIHRADRHTLNAALGAFEDTMTRIITVGWDIANEPWTDSKARVMALKEIREAHSAIFEKLFDAGVFERKLGTLDMAIRNTPLPPERKQAIRSVFTSWGLLEAPKEDAKPVEPNAQT